jgi:acetyltransferase-like isoleucine patch superfamily enzyme
MGEVNQGEECVIGPRATVGYTYTEGSTSTKLGDEVVIRTGSIVYDDVYIDDRTETGHNVLIREKTDIGSDCVVGTNAVIDGHTTIGDSVSLQTGVYVPSHTKIGDQVFIGPNAVLTNDPTPVRQNVDLQGPTIESSASIGANSTILPEIHIGKRAFVAAGAVVTKNVPPDALAIGAPATFKPLPEQLRGENDI